MQKNGTKKMESRQPFSVFRFPFFIFYKCKTLSLISCVRPWFQYCVPI